MSVPIGMACQASFKPLNAFVLPTRCNSLVNVEKYRERPVPRPTLTHDRIDTFPQPPRTRGMAEVVAAQA
jgi:hypothetical protein